MFFTLSYTGTDNMYHELKGHCHEIFYPQFFHLTNNASPTDSWTEVISKIVPIICKIFDDKITDVINIAEAAKKIQISKLCN
jgi:hypothetical protein